jgi:hypothetical protein
MKNVTIIQTDSRPGVPPYTRRFSTLISPRPCGVYTRHWVARRSWRGMCSRSFSESRRRMRRRSDDAVWEAAFASAGNSSRDGEEGS